MSAEPWERSARVYDAIYTSMKDYEADARMLHLWIQSRSEGARTLLDVACGTGLHLSQLKQWYQCEGLDASEAMLAVARERNSDLPFHQGDMVTFDLGRRFDAITCLFSAIGYVDDVEGLNAAIANFAAHLTPGGVCVVEPWFSPNTWREDMQLDLMTVDEPDLKIARVSNSKRDGTHTVLVMDHLVVTPDGAEHYTETHHTTLFTVAEYRAAFEAAGLVPDHDPEGFIGRGIWFGTLPG
jgi:SAM-dependent methyltransferase